MVDLYVGSGENERQFRVHKEVLCDKLEYFDKMFNGGFAEVLDNEARFPEDDPEYFDVLLDWVYSGSLRILENNPSPYFFILYDLADGLCCTHLMDQIMDTWIAWGLGYSLVPAMSLGVAIYSRNREGSAPRR